jgi:small conductance mechanosensitive channel
MSQFFQSIIDRLTTIFDPQSLGTLAADRVANLLIGAITFLVYYLVWRVLDVAARAVSKRFDFDATSRDFTLTVMKFAVLTFAGVSALTAVGVNTASLLTSLGIAGLTLGFAARDALSNMISGVLIYWDRPFVIGDLVEVGASYGRVDRITLRSTRVVTPDGRMLAVPNTEIINTTVASYTNFPHLRIDIPIAVSVDTDLEAARGVLLELVLDDSHYMTSPLPVVIVKQLNDYNVVLELRAWLEDERRHIEARTALREAAFVALTRAGFDMPFETFRIEPLTVNQAAA